MAHLRCGRILFVHRWLAVFRLDKQVFESEMNTRKLKDKLWRKIFNVPYSYVDKLLDRSGGWAIRDDYATFMIDYDEPEVEEALFRVASDPTEEDDMAESCGEAVAEIWCRKGTLKIDALRKLNPAALEEALGIIKVRQPEWVSALQKEGLMNYEEESLVWLIVHVRLHSQYELTNGAQVIRGVGKDCQCHTGFIFSPFIKRFQMLYNRPVHSTQILPEVTPNRGIDTLNAPTLFPIDRIPFT